MKLFVSYRRDDSRHITDRIHEHLSRRFSKKNVFKDVDALQPGDIFDIKIRDHIKSCNVFLVVIGQMWTTIKNENGKPRLFDKDDYVRQEIELAIKYHKKIVPILVDGTALPEPKELPASIRPLLSRQSYTVRRDPHFARDIKYLLSKLKRFDIKTISLVLLFSLIAVGTSLYTLYELTKLPAANSSHSTETELENVDSDKTNDYELKIKTIGKGMFVVDNYDSTLHAPSFWKVTYNGSIIANRSLSESDEFIYGLRANEYRLGEYSIFIESLKGDEFIQTSNSIDFTLDRPSVSIELKEDYSVSKILETNTELIDLSWIVKRNSEVILTRSANSEQGFNYFQLTNKKSTGSYDIYLESFIDGRKHIVSNVLEFDINKPNTVLSLGDELVVTRSLLPEKDEIFWKPGWVVMKDGKNALERSAQFEANFKYHVQNKGVYRVFVNAFVNGEYQQISNEINYTID